MSAPMNPLVEAARLERAVLDQGLCSVESCDNTYYAKGLCNKHWQRLRSLGTTELRTATDRITAGLERKPNGCLEWTGLTNAGGYGRTSLNGKPDLTHRIVWILANGPIPDGLHVLHHCDNPPCAETEPSEAYPDGHLFLGTNDDNVADMDAKGRRRPSNKGKTHCKSGHAFDEANTYVWSGSGKRHCRLCNQDANARYKANRAARTPVTT